MVSESRKTPRRSQRQPLSEAAGSAPFGTILGWRTARGNGYGIVLGREGTDFLCLSIFDRNLRKDPLLAVYRDEALSDKLAPLMPGVMANVQRVPGNRAFRHGLMKGAALRPYVQAAAHLQLEGIMYAQAGHLLGEVFSHLDEEMWIQKAVKKPGRLPKILGIKADDWEGMEKGAKLKAIDAKLAELEGDSGKAAKSMRGALVLGKRFIDGAIGGRKAR